MKRSDISDEAAIRACGAGPGGGQRLAEETGLPIKVVCAKLEHLYDRDLLEVGVSINSAWPTRAGWALLGIDREQGFDWNSL